MMDIDSLEPIQERLWADLMDLSQLRESDCPGWSRRVFSDPYAASRAWVESRMCEAGLEVTVDPAGNIVGRLKGRHSGPPLVTGSHTDTVLGGGRFDGIVGVLGGIEAARRFRETSTMLDHDLLVVDFLGEEANPYGGSCLGSQAAVGALAPPDLERTDPAGAKLGDALSSFGVDPEGMFTPSWAQEDLHGYLELHVEQGPSLEQKGIDVGIVTSIVGVHTLLATFLGRPDHAGTRNMDDRRDALVAAAKAVLTVEREACGAPVHAVATSGNLLVEPGSGNVIPGRTQLTAEFRSDNQNWLSGVQRRITDEILRQSAENGVEAFLDWAADSPVVPTSASVQNVTASTLDGLGVPWAPVPSGAGHDAAHLAARCPTGMIFVPSHNGRSHCPEEWTDREHLSTGVHVLAATLLQMDRADTLAFGFQN